MREYKKMKRQIHSVTDEKGNLITEPTSVNIHFFNHFRNTYSADEPQQIELEEFLSNDINKLGKITKENAKIASRPFDIPEIRVNIMKLRKAAQGGPDGITNRLLLTLFYNCPNLVKGAINEKLPT